MRPATPSTSRPVIRMVLLGSAIVAVAGCGATATKPAGATAGAAATPDGQDVRLPIRLGATTYHLAARVFRPSGAGPAPLVVINHGTPIRIRDAPGERLGFTRAAAWFARQGFVAVVALRPGFGSSDGPYLEPSGPCDHRDYVQDGRETAEVEAAIVESAAGLPGVDARRIVVVGQSAGGFGVIALADRPPLGVLGVISFAGGRGGDGREHVCGGARSLVDAAGVFGRGNRLPQLWLFASNDHFFPPPVARAMLAAYQAGSGPKLTFVDLPPFDGDGHRTLGHADPAVYATPVLAFLHEVGAAARP